MEGTSGDGAENWKLFIFSTGVWCRHHSGDQGHLPVHLKSTESYGRHLINPCAQMASSPHVYTLTAHSGILALPHQQAGAPTDHASDQPGRRAEIIDRTHFQLPS